MDALWDQPPAPQTLDEPDEFKPARCRQMLAQLAVVIPEADVACAHHIFESLDPQGIVVRFDLTRGRR